MKCTVCGAEIHIGEEYCSKCGAPADIILVSSTEKKDYFYWREYNPLPNEFIEAANAFASKSFASIIEGSDDLEQGLAFSPICLQIILSALMAGSEEKAAQQIENELAKCCELESIDVESFTDDVLLLVSHLVKNPYVMTEVANSIWVNSSFAESNGQLEPQPKPADANGQLEPQPRPMNIDAQPEKSAQTRADDQFDAFDFSTYEIPFNGNEAVERVKNWVYEKTHGKIAPILPISSDLKAILLCALYAKIAWRHEFSKDDTVNGTFFNDHGNGDAWFMHKTLEESSCFITDDCTLVKLDCAGGYRMDFLMPKEVHYFDSDSLSQSELARFFRAFDEPDNTYANIELYVPKFDVATGGSITKALRNMGLTRIFEAQNDTKFAPGETQISEIIQGARVTIDENGIEGASYIAAPMRLGLPPEPEEYPTIEIMFDHPFAFRVMTDDGVPIFMGVVTEATAENNSECYPDDNERETKRTNKIDTNRIAYLEFSIGGFFGGYPSIQITHAYDCGIVFTSKDSFDYDDDVTEQNIPIEDFFSLCKTIRDIGVFEWDEEYRNPNVFDGTQWELEIRDEHGAVFNSSGSNEFPDGFEEFEKLMRDMGLPTGR